MRFVRVVLGLLLALVGLVVTLASLVAAFWLVGPDDTVDTGPQRLTSKGLAVATAPDLLDRHGPILHVTAEDSPRPVFVGIGHDLDVTSYLGGSAYTRVVRLDLPPALDTQELTGGATKLNPPAGLDWWIVQASGAGEQSVAWPIDDGAFDVVVMNADGTPGTDAQVTFGVELPGLFVTCLLVFLGGLVLLALGLLLMFLRRRRPGVPAPPVPITPPVPQYEWPAPEYQPAADQPPADEPPADEPPVDEPPEGEPAGDEPPGDQPPAYRPPPQYQGWTARRTAVALTGAMLLLAATGCVAVPEQNLSEGPATRPAVTVAAGQAVVKRYNEVNNRANQTRDAKLAETIEANPTLAMTRAGYEIGRKLDATGKDKIKPFTYTEPEIGAPRYGSYPMRFVVDSGVSDSPDSRQLGVWERADAGSPWVLTHSVYPAATMKVPSMDGLRTPAEADLDKLAALPQSAAQNLAAYLSDGARSPKAGLFEPSPGMAGLLDNRAKAKVADAEESYIATVSDTFRPTGDPVTFITSAGEGLVFLALTEQYLQRIEPGSSAHWKGGAMTAFSNRVKYTQTLTLDYLHQVALVIPLKGKGKLRILSIDGHLLDAGGS